MEFNSFNTGEIESNGMGKNSRTEGGLSTANKYNLNKLRRKRKIDVKQSGRT
jgi:peptide deformylase